jgi:hypothetical protein
VAREYTGTRDGVAAGRRAGLEEFVKQVEKLSGGALWNNGTWVVRNMRGKESLSVHATGRAVDLSWRKLGTKGVADGREPARRTIRTLVQHAELLQIESVLDYFPDPHGRGWRCDRGTWQTYQRPTISGAGGGDWFHVEIAPTFADDAAAYRQLFQQLTTQETV